MKAGLCVRNDQQGNQNSFATVTRLRNQIKVQGVIPSVEARKSCLGSMEMLNEAEMTCLRRNFHVAYGHCILKHNS